MTLPRLIMILALTLVVQQPPSLTGVWEGTIDVQGRSLPIAVTFSDGGDTLSATIDIPQQGAKAMALTSVTRTGGGVRFELRTSVMAVFDGQLDGDRLSGPFTQGPAVGTFSLTRRKAPAAPEPTPPYEVSELTVTNGPVSLAGTLTRPPVEFPVPAVVLVTGSGPQNRDEDIFGFKVFAAIADHLTRQGIAVYRYDDRGVGRSTGNIAQSTTADFADDALAAVAALRARPDIDDARVGILGHSEGALAAAIAAAKSPDVAFIVMLAGPGLPGNEVTRQQAADGARAMGATEEQIATIVAQHRALTDAVRSDSGVDVLTRAVQNLIGAQYDGMPAAQRAALGARADFIEKTYRPPVGQLSTPWMKFFMAYDPAVALRSVKAPVLAIFGQLDTQVPPALNEPPLRQALSGNSLAAIKVYPQANHLFQRATTGQVTEYGLLEKAFVPSLLPDVSTWILSITQR